MDIYGYTKPKGRLFWRGGNVTALVENGGLWQWIVVDNCR